MYKWTYKDIETYRSWIIKRRPLLFLIFGSYIFLGGHMHFCISFRLEPDVAYVLCQVVFDCWSDNYQLKLKEERCNQLHVTFNSEQNSYRLICYQNPMYNWSEAFQLKHVKEKSNVLIIFNATIKELLVLQSVPNLLIFTSTRPSVPNVSG